MPSLGKWWFGWNIQYLTLNGYSHYYKRSIKMCQGSFREWLVLMGGVIRKLFYKESLIRNELFHTEEILTKGDSKLKVKAISWRKTRSSKRKAIQEAGRAGRGQEKSWKKLDRIVMCNGFIGQAELSLHNVTASGSCSREK